MKKLIAIILSLSSVVAGAQTFPVQNLHVLGTSVLDGAVSGAGVNTLFSSPLPIGNIAPNTGSFTNLTVTTPPTLSTGNLYPSVATNANLLAMPTTATTSVVRLGFNAAGDADPLLYQASGSACSLNSGNGDNGSQVKSADGKCWIAAFPSSSVDVKEWGARFNGVADDTSAIQAAVIYLSSLSNGGVLNLPAGTSNISSTIVLQASNIKIAGKGHGGNHDAGSGANGATVLNWIGSSIGMFFIGPPPSAARALTGSGLTGVFLQGNSSATYGVFALSVRGGVYDFAGSEFTSAMMYMGCQTGMGEAADSQSNVVSLYGRQFLSNGYILQIDGISNANTSFNIFQVIKGQYRNAPAIYVGSADNNTFVSVQLTQAGGGTAAAGVLLDASAFSVPAASNMFINLSPGNAGVYAAGTERNTFPSIYNSILYYDKGNGPPDPVSGTNAILYWGTNYQGAIATRKDTLTSASNSNWFIDTRGRFHVYAVTASVPGSSTGTFTLPAGITVTTGIQSIQLTPRTNSISTYSAQYVGGSNINVNNGSATATDFWIEVTGF